jgi:DNA end-binding protein Ku
VELPSAGRKALNANELKMASRLIEEMSAHWDPADYPNNFRDAVMALVEKKAKAGKTQHVEPLEEAPESAANVVDLTELLKRSLKAPAKTRKRA